MVKATVIFGSDATIHYNETGEIPSDEWLEHNGGVVDYITFNTLEEYAAYSEALSDADGWNDYIISEPEISEEQKPSQKELWVFLFPVNGMDRDASDARIVAAYESDGNGDCDWPVEKLTPDEFACRCNDDQIFAEQYVRFIAL